MANIYISINKGESGFKNSDFATGASSTAGDDIELRVTDGAGLTREDVQKALKAFQRWFKNKDNTTFPKL